MAQQAEVMRASAGVELTEVIRQAERYMRGHKPSTRLIEQKIKRVREKLEDVKRYHFAFCEKSKISVDSNEALQFLREHMDKAEDCVDEGSILVDGLEGEKRQEEQENDKTATEAAAKRRDDALLQRCITEVSIDERIVKDLCMKINEVVAQDEQNSANSTLVKTYLQGLADSLKSLQESWKQLKSIQVGEELETTSRDIFTLRASVQTAISEGTVFMEKCDASVLENKEAPPTVSSTTRQTDKSMITKPDKVKNPTFTGDIRTFAKFKRDFEKITAPFYPDPDQQVYVLKECLKGNLKVLALVENIEDLGDVWKRLEDRFGDKIDLVDVVLKDLGDLPTMKANDDSKFIDLVDKLERGLLDLDAIGARDELANLYTIKIIEKKLNRSTYMDWLKQENALEGCNRFEKLFKFLEEERRRVEKLVRKNEHPTVETTRDKTAVKGAGSYGAKETSKGSHEENMIQHDRRRRTTRNNNCLIHKESAHFTRRCRVFLGMSAADRAYVIKRTKGCPLCLSISHPDKPCDRAEKWGTCNIDNCQKYHSHLLHDAEKQGLVTSESKNETSAATGNPLSNGVLLLVQRIPLASKGSVTAFFDNGSTISLISSAFVKRKNMRGIPISYNLTTVGGQCRRQLTFLHEIRVRDHENQVHVIKAFEIGDICGSLQRVDVSHVIPFFHGLNLDDVRRPKGPIEMLVGMRNANLHPWRIAEVDGLVLYESVFGSRKILGGCHQTITSKDRLSSAAQIVARLEVSDVQVTCSTCRVSMADVDFFTTEEFGVKLVPRCERCKNCKTCTFEAHQISRVEARELTHIRENLVLNPLEECWTTPYPYLQDPATLENNLPQAEKFLEKLEKRLGKSQSAVDQFNSCFEDFVRRGVFREIPEEEIINYNGPVFYVTIHEVFKEGSTTTPMRLVTNSSLKFKGRCLNDVLMKGPNTLNNICNVQLRFRCYKVGIVCDMSKMYHSISTTTTERHLRRVLHRDLDSTKETRTYGIEKVNFGDRPAAAIAGTAVKKTAETFRAIHPEACDKIVQDSYVDDIVTGADDDDEATTVKQSIEEILRKGGFKIKGFTTSGDEAEPDRTLLPTRGMESVLGVWWNPGNDIFRVKVRINLSKKHRQARTSRDLEIDEIPKMLEMVITRRLLLSIANSCNDPYGSLGPITVSLKIGLRRINGRDWDEDLEMEIKEEWIRILVKLKEAESVTFRRCVKPDNAIGNPTLVVCNDGSETAMCTTAHVRWICDDGSIQCRLWASKTRVTPLKKLTIPNIELMSAMMGVRLANTIKKSSIWKFEDIFHMTDSKCMLATLSKETSALGEFVGNRVTEILDSTDVNQWYHIGSRDNIADLGTRGQATISEIAEDSDWQVGTSWMHLPVDQWPVDQSIGRNTIPEEFLARKNVVAHLLATEVVLQYEKYKGRSYDFARNLTARILKIARTKSLKVEELTPDDMRHADDFMIKSSMALTKRSLEKGFLSSLRPVEKEDGTIILGGRAMEGMCQFYGKMEFPILTQKDPLSHLWIKKVHREDHSGVTRTVAKSRREFWIIHARRLAEKVKRSCFMCRLIDKLMAQQQMAPLPKSRQVMSPTFAVVSMDLFGPFQVKDTVKKRTRIKVWGLVINCLSTRALHLDITEGYGTEDVIQTIRKFIALRGSPSVIHTDKGSQLISTELTNWALANEIDWKPTPAEGQHQNGCSESLIKSVKRSLTHVVGNNVLTFSGLQTVMYEVATLINSRPIGIVTGSDPTRPEAITPNHLILGRATSAPFRGPSDKGLNPSKRQQFLQNLVSTWWKVWYDSVLPTLVPSYKWLQRHRNVEVGDICLIRYKNEIKGNYRLGKVKSAKKGNDGLVRTVTLLYKNSNEKTFREVDRPIHGICVIVPIEEQRNDVSSQLDPNADVFNPGATTAQNRGQ